ncbi:hypothetical protein [Actinokineospora sp. NBRC 105648]|uniref:hypothetical protein n=1 Tax=Actinokineospora sp. NBRC 105648 TaxID=3032206 RepID=UPI002557AF66|nr:hypothetical protein [Actinokineospora sp. NBRC 105648]
MPAPSRGEAVRKRGGHHLVRVAEVAAAWLVGQGIDAAVAPALRFSRGARDSVGLTPGSRAANLARHLVIDPRGTPPARAPVVVLDDIVTTGATAAACARVLEAAGHPVLLVLACAATV